MYRRVRARHGLAFALASLVALPACEDDGLDIEPTAAFRARQATYLERCSTLADGMHAQNCRAYLGLDTYNVSVIESKLAKLHRRDDTSDFDLNSILRVLAFDRRDPSLPSALRADMVKAALEFKYWLDEPGPDDMVWWSENHQILFAAAEMLAGVLWPDAVFPNSGMTGEEHLAKALPRIERWLDERARFGFSEWHSNVYFDEDIPALVNIVDFCPDPELAKRAAMILDVMAFDMASNYYRGNFATTHGRTYPSALLDGLSDATRDSAWIMLGLGTEGEISSGNFSATYLATSDRYTVPPVLERVADDAREGIVHRQRDGITFEEGPRYGIGYSDPADVVFWWGMTGYFAPKTVQGTFDTVERYDMWQGNIWADLSIIRPFVQQPPLARIVATALEEMSRGAALEAVNTYTRRTPHWQLSGAQDYKPGSWTGQVHVWQATLDREAYVFTTYPGGLEGDYMAGDWTGGFVPRATFHENVGVIQYRRPRIPILDEVLFKDYSHAYFPRAAFDEVVETGHWVIGRKGEGYVALWSQTAPTWSAEREGELVADAKENVWIVELGDLASSGGFASFVAGIQAAPIRVGESVRYTSPSRGLVEVGWEGPFVVAGSEIDLGPYPRWDNAYARQDFGTRRTVIQLDGGELDLDFVTGRRAHVAP